MSDHDSNLQRLARRCLVRVGGRIADDPCSGGSGAWVAPGMVLTCAHVVPEGLGAKVQVASGGRYLTGEVIAHTPTTNVALWGYPDLALVEVEEAPAGHPCVWLAELDLIRSSEVVVFGHSGQLEDALRPSVLDGRVAGRLAFGDGELWQFKGNEVLGGMSGGPVLDPITGMVCAVMKTTIGTDADRGGFLVPVQGLRAFPPAVRSKLLRAADRFHGDDRRWTALRSALPAPPGGAATLLPDEEADLFSLLAVIAEEGETWLRRIYAGSAPNSRPLAARLDVLRDVATALLDSGVDVEDGVLPLLRLSQLIAGSPPQPARQALYDWATAFAARWNRTGNLRQLRATPPQPPTVAVITVEIAPGCSDISHYRLTVTVQDQNGQCRRLYCDESPKHTLAEAKTLVGTQLREALCWLGGDTLIEFVVPMELFDEPFEQLSPIRSYSTIGRKFRVVLRDYDRQKDPYARDDWNRRWDKLISGTGTVRHTMCTDDRTAEQMAAELELDAGAAVMVVARRPGSNEHVSGLVKLSLDAGVPALAWRRDTCSEHDRGPVQELCSGSKFVTAFDRVVRAGTPTALPGLVQSIRQGAAAKHVDPDAQACDGVVLVWDDPSRVAGAAAALTEPLLRGQDGLA